MIIIFTIQYQNLQLLKFIEKDQFSEICLKTHLEIGYRTIQQGLCLNDAKQQQILSTELNDHFIQNCVSELNHQLVLLKMMMSS